MEVYCHSSSRSKCPVLCGGPSPDSFQTPRDCWVLILPSCARSSLSRLSTSSPHMQSRPSHLRATAWRSCFWGWTRSHSPPGLARTPGGPREKTAVPVTDSPELPSHHCRKPPPPPRSSCPPRSGSISARRPSNRPHTSPALSCTWSGFYCDISSRSRSLHNAQSQRSSLAPWRCLALPASTSSWWTASPSRQTRASSHTRHTLCVLQSRTSSQCRNSGQSRSLNRRVWIPTHPEKLKVR